MNETINKFEAGQIYNADCLEMMAQMDQHSIDAVVCDLPYGMTRNNWDSVIPLDKLWEQYHRIVKPGGAILLFAQCPFDKILGASNINELRYEWIWHKEAGSNFLNSHNMPMKIHENILVFCSQTPIYHPQMRPGNPYVATRKRNYCEGTISNYDVKHMKDNVVTVNKGDRYPVDVLSFDDDSNVLYYPRDKEKIHRTQKPVDLIRYLLRTHTNEGDLILDNCAGSASTAVAAEKENRRWICIEKDTDICEAARERIRSMHNQPTLIFEW